MYVLKSTTIFSAHTDKTLSAYHFNGRVRIKLSRNLQYFHNVANLY
jgi:hypothetical protein